MADRRGAPHFHQRGKLVVYLLTWSGDALKSTFGAQIERLERTYTGSKTCAYCRGSGFVISNLKLRKKGAKRPVSDPARAFFEHIGIDPNELEPQADAFCPRCWGRGVVPRASKYRPTGRITARPTGSSRTTERGGYTLDENAIPLCGSVGRWLALVHARDANAAATIEVYFQHGETRVPIWLCTEGGRGLLHRSEMGRRALKAVDLDGALRVLDNERFAQQQSPDAQREALMRAADREADALLVAAARIWNGVVPTADEEAEQDFRKAVGL